jgi:hypothetical protein
MARLDQRSRFEEVEQCDEPSHLRRGRYESARRGRMRQGPAKVDFSLHDLAGANGQHLRVLEASARVGAADIGDVDAIVFGNEGDELEFGDPSAVRPAAFEIALSIDAIVERAREMEVSAMSRSIAARSLST